MERNLNSFDHKREAKLRSRSGPGQIRTGADPDRGYSLSVDAIEYQTARRRVRLAVSAAWLEIRWPRAGSRARADHCTCRR
jgi:hypothetical protein